jgi:hypothetical protein
MQISVAIEVVVIIYVLVLLYFIVQRIFNGTPSTREIVRFPIIMSGYVAILTGLHLVMSDEERLSRIDEAKLNQAEYIRYCEINQSFGAWDSLWLTYAVDGEDVARRQHATLIQYDEYTHKNFDDEMISLNQAKRIPEKEDEFIVRYQELHRKIPDIIRRGSFLERIKDGSLFVVFSFMVFLLTGHARINH